MTGVGENDSKVVRLGSPSARSERLPYRIELWERANVERVLARAQNALLARAIFKAARSEYPDRRITLCRGSRTIADTHGD